jgi:hypothetical protein
VTCVGNARHTRSGGIHDVSAAHELRATTVCAPQPPPSWACTHPRPATHTHAHTQTHTHARKDTRTHIITHTHKKTHTQRDTQTHARAPKAARCHLQARRRHGCVVPLHVAGRHDAVGAARHEVDGQPRQAPVLRGNVWRARQAVALCVWCVCARVVVCVWFCVCACACGSRGALPVHVGAAWRPPCAARGHACQAIGAARL